MGYCSMATYEAQAQQNRLRVVSAAERAVFLRFIIILAESEAKYAPISATHLGCGGLQASAFSHVGEALGRWCSSEIGHQF
uniref:Transposase n=1 Tax=Heterorhabditis bacteriophora TaxID=37862 RepID=A0A1I7XPF6_HETBA